MPGVHQLTVELKDTRPKARKLTPLELTLTANPSYPATLDVSMLSDECKNFLKHDEFDGQ
jgi:hypothetical protein